jgi:hypothetical protein
LRWDFTTSGSRSSASVSWRMCSFGCCLATGGVPLRAKVSELLGGNEHASRNRSESHARGSRTKLRQRPRQRRPAERC